MKRSFAAAFHAAFSRSARIPNLKCYGYIALMLLISSVLPRYSEGQDKCEGETADAKAIAERQGKLETLKREMRPEFTFTIGETAVLGHLELTGAKPPDAALLKKQVETQHELAKKAGVAASVLVRHASRFPLAIVGRLRLRE